MRSGAMAQKDRPVWYDVYAAFPPKTEPLYNRDISNKQPLNIIYREDFIRA